jgi:hypothetical protein
MVKSAIPSSTGSNARIGSGNNGTRIRSTPYTPIFDINPVSNTVTAGGASAYVSGTQV